jgi:tRNA modification GTPase
MTSDTIFALASARGKAGVAVIRLSGPESWAAVADLCGKIPAPRRASVRTLRQNGEVIDEALVLTFAKGASFTGEEAAELHTHGSLASVSALLRALGERPGMRLAEPGEFTRRALENGRLDLTQVEGLADLIEAETDAQRRQALRVASGQVARMAEGWRRSLVRAAALIEATIDFADEDVPVDVSPEVAQLLASTRADLQRQADGFGAAERIRDGFEVAIVGSPNVGKSTLLNALTGREAAITSHVAGTTRDVIEVRMDVAGLAVTLLDTAGIRETDDVVEAIGVDRARRRAEAADLRVFLVNEGEEPGLAVRDGDLILRAKADLLDDASDMAVSGLTGYGIERLVRLIEERLAPRVASAGVLTRVRHRTAVLRASESLAAAEASLGAEAGAEIVAEDIRRAIRALDFLVGRIDVDDVLGEIFSTFCIGK